MAFGVRLLALYMLARMLAPARCAKPKEIPLARSADSIAFVRARLDVVDLTTGWRGFGVYRGETLKGEFRARQAEGKDVWLSVKAGGCPTMASLGLAVYLVFLDRRDAKGHWPVLAAIPVEYAPDANGHIVGTLPGRLKGGEAPSREAIARLVRAAAKEGNRPGQASRMLEVWLRSAQSRVRTDAMTHEERMRWAERMAAAIRPGTTRADLEKVFPQRDGGLSGPNSTRYYAGAEVMVEAPFDTTGGAVKPTNRVSGSIKVTKSGMHID
ncbi:MAG TPA: hypothetical protein VGM37_17715 [Armatimonadota bacterium]|jgi:hypothetical protein